MLDAPVQLVGNLEGCQFVGQWRIGDSAPWQKFEFSSQAQTLLFQGFFELVKSKNSKIKVEETFEFEDQHRDGGTNEEVLSGQGTNQFGNFSISGKHNLLTNEFTGEKRYTTWAGDIKAAQQKKRTSTTTKRRRKKKTLDSTVEDEDEDFIGEAVNHASQLEIPSVVVVAPVVAPPPPPPPPVQAETNQSKARKRILDFVLQIPNRHVYPYDPLDLGNDLARKRYLQAQSLRAANPVATASSTTTLSRPRGVSHSRASSVSSLPVSTVFSPRALPSLPQLPIALPTNEPPALDLFRYPSTSVPKQSSHSSSSANSSSRHSFASATWNDTIQAEAKFESDGSVYEGQLLNQQRHGYGICGYWNGHLYIGNFKKGQEHGSGELRDATGALIYRGMFEHGRISGFGTMYYSDGAVFQGEFRESNRHGKGIIWYADGSYYDGDFFHGARSGFGKFVDVKSNSQYFGEWSNDQRHGTGRLDLGNGSYLDGSFKDNLSEGRCFCQYPNGDQFEGNFKEGLREGRGTYTFANKAKLEGRFSRDEAISKTGTLELEENTVIELPHATNPLLSEWLTPIKDPNESHITAGFGRDGT